MFLKVNKFGLADWYLSSITTLFRVKLSDSFYGVHNCTAVTVPHGICVVTHKLECRLCSHSTAPATDILDKSKKLCSSKTKINLVQDDGNLESLIRCEFDPMNQIGMNMGSTILT